MQCEEWNRISAELRAQDAKEWAEAIQRTLNGRGMDTVYEENDRGVNTWFEKVFGYNPKWGTRYATAGPKKCSVQ